MDSVSIFFSAFSAEVVGGATSLDATWVVFASEGVSLSILDPSLLEQLKATNNSITIQGILILSIVTCFSFVSRTKKVGASRKEKKSRYTKGEHGHESHQLVGFLRCYCNLHHGFLNAVNKKGVALAIETTLIDFLHIKESGLLAIAITSNRPFRFFCFYCDTSRRVALSPAPLSCSW